MSNFLEHKIIKIRVRAWLSILLCIFNFLFAYGAAIYYNNNGSSFMLTLGIIGTVIIALLLAIPNKEKNN